MSGNYLFRQLEQTLAEVLVEERRELPFENGTIVPTFSDLQEGAPRIVQRYYNNVGSAAVVGYGDTDIPVIDLNAGEDTYKVLMVSAAYSMNFQEYQAAQQAQNNSVPIDINRESMMVVDRAIQEKANRLAAFGDADLGITGFLNDPNVTSTVVGTGVIDFYNAATSGKDIAEWFLRTVGQVRRGSRGVYFSGDVLVPDDLSIELDAKLMPESEVSVSAHLLSRSISVRSIRAVYEAEAADLQANGIGDGSNDRITFHTSDRLAVKRHNMPTRMMPEDWWYVKDGRKVMPMYQCVSPTMVNYPTALQYFDIPKRP